MKKKHDFETRAVHAGLRDGSGPNTPTVSPIVASTTFTGNSIHDVHAALGPDPQGFAYSRNANPTVASLESAIAGLEGTDDAIAFGSGMGAIHAALLAASLGPGDVIVAAGDLYGVTRGLFLQLEEYDIHTKFVDVLTLDAVDSALSRADARLLFFESISNPLLRVPDVAGLAALARRHRRPVMLDNTFATPYLLRPAELGVDIVIHSASKYIAGHGDVTAGLVAANRSWSRRIRTARTVTGSVLSPFEAWLTLRGIRTLPLRMERHVQSALVLAAWLNEQGWVARTHYPGLPGNPQHEVASTQFGGKFGGMLAFELNANRTQTLEFIDALELIAPGTSLGDAESLVLYPPLSSHRTLDAAGLLAAGISQGLIRLSVGLESVRDLQSDLEQAASVAGLNTAGVAVAT